MNGILSGEYWPGWLSGLALSVLIVAYFGITGRVVASSGRLSKVIDRFRYGPQPECSSQPEELSELAEALRLASVEAFGADAVESSLAVRPTAPPRPRMSELRPRVPLNWMAHLAFLIGIVLGGRAAQPLAPIEWSLGEGVWASVIPESMLPYLLSFAGMLVGFGTRMAGGCPIGHGLCGMARGHAGSWATGLSFFGAGVAVVLFVRSL